MESGFYSVSDVAFSSDSRIVPSATIVGVEFAEEGPSLPLILPAARPRRRPETRRRTAPNRAVRPTGAGFDRIRSSPRAPLQVDIEPFATDLPPADSELAQEAQVETGAGVDGGRGIGDGGFAGQRELRGKAGNRQGRTEQRDVQG